MAKVFQIFVPDNTLVSRIISCENQVTELFVIDRADKKFFSEYSSDLSKPALYILVNRDLKKLYVGETDDSITRLKNHEMKDFWTEAIVFHSSGDTLSTTEVRWLEAKTYEVLSLLGYYDLSENKKVPQAPPLKKNQNFILEPIFEEAKNYICAAGFDIFLKKKEDNQTSPDETGTSSYSSDKRGNVWLIPFNKKYFDLDGCIKKYGRVYWSQKCSFALGDTVYVYSSLPDAKITYCFKVHEVDVQQSLIKEGNEFRKSSGKQSFKETDLASLFVSIGNTNSKVLTLDHLKEYGLKSAPMGPILLSQPRFQSLLGYIESSFDAEPEDNNGLPSKRPRFKFSMCNIKIGESVFFSPLNLEVKVAGDDTIKYQGKEYKLSSFTKLFIPDNMRTPSDAYQGSQYFTYKGEVLEKIRKRIESKDII